MSKHFTNQFLNEFRDSFLKQAEWHKYPTRNAKDYTLTRNKEVFSDQTVRRPVPSGKHFRNQFKTHLISQHQFLGLEQIIFCFILLCVCI